ncbi:hypothetical protein E3T61_07295 [Cryobacterium lactosi]|uniref:Uncharacterized protein n=1 Tax=Cryobacterium lactosi TaxID=1259202 RepID=A0A4R9BX66_9MICO|nr:hypothetical protein [Cryobacterium lactosi]TFD92103.1 hypothetical protein E3T61_07295 [Cryobacterium lactosi]
MSEFSTPANLPSAPVDGARVLVRARRWLERLGSCLFDHPSIVTSSLIGTVIAQFVLALWFPLIAVTAPFDHLGTERREIAVSALSLGVAGVAAMVGGFAGVVVLFGLSSIDERFRTIRRAASSSIQRNWMSVVTTPLAAAFGSLIASAMASAGATSPALWVLEGSVLLAAHGAIRLVVVLHELVKVVNESDAAARGHRLPEAAQLPTPIQRFAATEHKVSSGAWPAA